MPSGGGEGVGQRPSSLSEEPGGLDALHLAAQVASRSAVVEQTVLFALRSRVGGSRVATTLVPSFSGDLWGSACVEVTALCMVGASFLAR